MMQAQSVRSKSWVPVRVPPLAMALVAMGLAGLAAGCGGSGSPDAGYDFNVTPLDVPDYGKVPDVPDVPTDRGPAYDLTYDLGDADAPCVDGTSRCASLYTVEGCAGIHWVYSSTCTDGNICILGNCVKPENCTPGQVVGCYSADAQSVCADTGIAFVPRTCPDGQRCVMNGTCTTVVCNPTYGVCVDKTRFKTCKDDGSGYKDPEDCPESLQCVGGECHGMCESEIKVASYLGCEYWTVDLHNWDQPDTAISPRADIIPHAVAISNPGPEQTIVKFESYDPAIPVDIPASDLIIPAGGTKIYTMPVMSQTGSNINKMSVKITASHPVTASQFNPLNNVGVASNDAALLLPTNAMGKEYVAISFPTYFAAGMMGISDIEYTGFLTIVAVSPGDTKVDIVKAGGMTAAGPNMPSILYTKSKSLMLKQGEVWNLEAARGSMVNPWDLTGTIIQASAPIAAFGGQECAVIGTEADPGCCCCDHLEEQLIPLEAWGSEYHAIGSKPRGGDEGDYWLIIAGDDGVVVHTNPPIPGIDGVTLDKGKFKYFLSAQEFEVTATGRIGVAQYMISQMCTTTGTGDPSMTVFPAVDQYRKEYAILTPNKYATNWVTLVRPKDLPITLDGTAVLEMFTPFGSGTWEYAYVQMEPGVHHFAATEGFGVLVYGYDAAVSYGYPGGMNLTKKTPEPTRSPYPFVR